MFLATERLRVPAPVAEGCGEFRLSLFKSLRLAEDQDMLLSLALDPGPHEGRSRRGEQPLTMRGDVVAVSMADKNAFRSGLRPVRIEPQAKLRQVQAAGAQFNSKQGHAGSIGMRSWQSNAASDEGNKPNLGKEIEGLLVGSSR